MEVKINSTRKFQRTIENFVCGNCGQEVVGNGYTNHCPKCLWSKHVDNNPGDRASRCGALMEPVSIEKNGSEFVIVHKCVKCKHEKRNKVASEDNFDEVIRISTGRTKSTRQ